MRDRARSIVLTLLALVVAAGCQSLSPRANSEPVVASPPASSGEAGPAIDHAVPVSAPRQDRLRAPAPAPTQGAILPVSDTEACAESLPDKSDCPRPISVREDIRRLFPDLWDDTKSLVNCGNGLILGGGLGMSLAFRDGVDSDVRRYVAEHPERWGKFDDVLMAAGDPIVQVPVMFSLYGYSVWQQDDDLHDFTRALIHAHALTSLATVAVKGIADTDRPSDQFLDGRWGFPSYHSASATCIAATIEEYYGFKASVPWYVLAGLISWSRIDQQEHDLSDVCFGAVLGYVIGHSVGARHQQRDYGWELRPWYDARGTSGVQLEVPF